MKNFKRTLITSALPYANGPVHIGHLAGVYVPADIYARYLRMKGEEVLFVGGSDEHGVPITIKAKKEGVTPQDIVDRYHNIIKDSFAISASLSMSMAAPLPRHTAARRPISSAASTRRESLSKRLPNNYMTSKPDSSSPTDTSPALARTVATNTPTATSANSAAHRSTPPIS